MRLGAGMINKLHIMELEYAGSFSNGLTEISAPNAVLDGTSVSVPLAIISSSAADDAAGAAVRQVAIETINAAGDDYELLEYVTDGTTGVKIDDFPQRAMHMYANSWGASKHAEGNILLVRRGYQELATPTAITDSTETGLTANTLYYFKLNIDGAGVVEYYITVTTASCTFATLLTLLAAAKKVSDNTTISGVTWSLVSGDLRCTSNSTADTAAIAITAGTTGTDLLASLTGFTSVDTAVGSGYQELGLSDITEATETGLSPTSVYFYKVNLNGAGVVEYYITTTTVAVTFTQLVALLNTSRKESDDSLMTGMTWSLTGGDLRLTSDSALDTASIAITAGTTGTDLLASLTGFTSVDTAVGSGYQECGFTGKTAGSATGIAPKTAYYFTIAIDGGAAAEYYCETSTTPVTFTDLITALGSAVLASDGVTPLTGVTFSIVGGDLRCTSDERGATSEIEITAGTSGTDLLASLTGFVGMDAQTYSAYQEVGLTGKSSENLTGLLAASQYYFKLDLDGAGIVEYDITTGSDLSFTSIIALLNAETVGATWSLVDGDLRCTSDTTDGTGSISLTAGTTGDDFFAQLTGFSAIETAEYTGFQEFGLSGKTGSTATGLTTTQVYYFKLNLDGAGVTEHDITVTAGSTLFSNIITLLDAETPGATWTIVSGDLRCTSDDVTDSASVALSVAALSGASLFGAMTGFSAFETAGGTGYQELGLSGKTGTDVTGLTTTTDYYFKLNIDGAGVTEYHITVIAGSTLYSDIITLLNAATTGATWTIVGGDLRCTSDTTVTTSTIALSIATLSGTSLFESLTGFSALDTAGGIGYQEFGLTGKTTTTETGLTAENTYYFTLALNGGGATEYSIAVDPTTDTTYAGIVALMNAALVTAGVAAEFSYPDGKLRCTSDSGADSSAIALTAGTTGLDLFASLTGWTAFSSAVAYTFYLTIAAGANESDGAALFVPENWAMSIREIDLSVTNYTAANCAIEIQASRINFDDDNSDPDFNLEYLRVAVESNSEVMNPCRVRVADSGAKVTFKETYLGRELDGYTHIFVAIFNPTNAGRGIDTRS
jgi:hypothetical protein